MADTETEQTITTGRKRGRPFGTTKKTCEELAQSQREASSKWYYKNYEYRCAQKKKYYEANRERILERRLLSRQFFFWFLLFCIHYRKYYTPAPVCTL